MMATAAQIQQALQAARAAGNTQDVAALQNALSEATGGASNLGPVTGAAPAQASPAAIPSGPSREQLSQAFYAAKQAGNEDDARKIVGYVQQHGMTLAPPSADQANAAFQKQNAANVSAQNPVLTGLQGFGQSFVNTGRGLGQLVGLESNQDVANARQVDQALSNSRAGQVGNALGNVAQLVGGAAMGGIVAGAPVVAGLVPGAATSLGATLARGATLGAGYGLAVPHASTAEQLVNTGVGTLSGPVLTGAVKGVQGIGRGAQALVQRYAAPDAVAATRIGRALSNDGAAAAQLRTGTDPVAGVQPTLAQVLQTPKAVQLERAARNNPISGPDIAAQDLQNSAARTQALQQNVLSPTDELAARRARNVNFAPIADALQNAGFVDVGPLRFEAANLAQRGNNAMTRASAKKVLSFIDDNTAQAGQNEGMIPVADLHTLQHDLGTIVKKANPEAINTAQALRELQPFKSAIVGTVDSIVPGYRDALRQYAADSAPINTSRTIGDLLNPTKATATDLTGEPTITAARVKSVLSKDDRAPFKMTPQARKDLENVQASLQSRNAAQRSIGPMGSPTEENRLNQLLNAGARHSGAVTGAITGSYVAPGFGTVAGALLGHGADILDRAAQNRIAASLGKLVSNPNDAAGALERYLLLQRRRQAFNDALVPVGQYAGFGTVAGRQLGPPSGPSGGQ